MEINNLYYGILLYIIIVASLVLCKPNFVYDHKKGKYKEYGTSGNKTIFTLPVTAVLLAILIAIIVVVTTKKEPVQQQSNQYHQYQPCQPYQQYQLYQPSNIQYVPVYYQALQPQLENTRQIQNSVNIAESQKCDKINCDE